MPKIIEIKTQHAGVFKTLIEVIKDLLDDVNIDFINPDAEKEIGDVIDSDENSSDEESGSDSEDEESLNSDSELSDEDEKEKEKPKKKKEIEKKKKKLSKSAGIKIIAVDPTKSVLIYLKLDAENFQKFRCDVKRLTIGVKTNVFFRLIKTMDKEDHLAISLDTDDPNKLNIDYINKEKGTYTTNKMNLLDIEEEPISLPETKFDSRVVMPANDFQKICRDMANIPCDKVRIQVRDKDVVFSCKSDNAERVSVLTMKENSIEITHSAKDGDRPTVVGGTYGLQNLVLFGKCSNLCDDIEIYLKNDYPLFIKYSVATLGRILLVLTPIKTTDVEDSDDEDDDQFYKDEEVEMIAKK